MHCVEVFPVDEFVRVTFSITPRLMSSFNRVLKKRRSVLVGFSNPFVFMNVKCKSKVPETYEGYDQIFGYVRVLGGVQKQFGNPTTEYVKVREVERVDRSKIDRPFGFCDLLSGLDSGGVFLFVTFITDTPPHRAGIIKVLENTKVPPNTCPGQFNSATRSEGEKPSIEKMTLHEIHVLKLLDQVGTILRVIASFVAQVDRTDSCFPSACDELQNRVNHWG